MGFGREKPSKNNLISKIEIIKDSASKGYLSLLPKEDELSQYFKDSFVIIKPKGRVGGDGFWLHTHNSNVFVAVFTCQGDGYLANMMVRIYMDALKKIVDEYSIDYPGSILQFLYREVEAKFKRKSNILLNTNANVSIIKLDQQTSEMEFAGANMNLIQVGRNRSHIIKGQKQHVGETQNDNMEQYLSIPIENVEGSIFYLCSSGFYNLIAGVGNQVKFDEAKFTNFLSSIKGLKLDKQKGRIEDLLTKSSSLAGQNDDVMIVGLKM